MRRRAAFQPSHESLAAHLASLNTCRLSGCRTFKVNLHAPAGSAPAIPQKSGGAFGIPELTPPIRRQTIRVRLYNRQSDAHRLYGKSLREDFK